MLVDNVSLLQRRALMVNATVWIPDSNTENGIAEVPLTDVTLQAFNDQIQLAGPEPWLFRSSTDPKAHQTTFKRTWHATLRRAGISYFRIYDLRADVCHQAFCWRRRRRVGHSVLRQGDAKVFKKY